MPAVAQAPAPSMDSPSEQSPIPIPPSVNLQSGPSASSTAENKPVNVLPPPSLSLPPTLDVPPQQQQQKQQSSGSRTGLMLALIAVMLLILAGGAYYTMGRSGELIIVADPARELIVIVDQKPVAVSDSPVRLRLPPGQHAVSVQHTGHTPWNDNLAIVAGETVVRNVKLDLIVQKTGGFTLLSDPPGAAVKLDGNSLGQVTPLRVQSVLAGPHTLELQLGNRIWHQQVTVEADKTIDIKATLPPEGHSPAGPSDAPRVTPLETTQNTGTGDKPAPTGDKPAPTGDKPTGDKPGLATTDKPAPTGDKPAPTGDKPAPGEKPAKPGLAKKGPPRKKKGGAGDTPIAPQASGNNGYLRINSRPWSKIIVDGLDTGLNTPQTSYRLPAGKHQVTLYNPQFNIKETFVVTVQPGETQTITKIFQQH